MDLDVTLLFQLTLLAGLVATLGRTLFAPLLHVIEQRHHKIYGLHHEIDRLHRLAQADEAAYTDKMRLARRQAQAARDALRASGRAQARSMLTAARTQLAAAHAQTRQAVHGAETAARQAAEGDVSSLADQVVRKLLAPQERR